MQHLSKRARRFALALGLATSIVGFSAVQTFAQPVGGTDPGVRCAAKVGPGQYEFYLPGEKATDVNGNKWVCGTDGQWHRDYSSMMVVSSMYRLTTTQTTALIAQ